MARTQQRLGSCIDCYAVTMTNGQAGFDRPPGFLQIGTGSDTTMVEDGEYAVTHGATVDPQWTWYFGGNAQSAWLATVLALNPTVHLAFTVQPCTTLPLFTIQPAVQVTSFNGPVTIAIGHNGGLIVPGKLSGTKTVNAVNGVATFSDLSIDQLGNGYTLDVTAPDVSGAESAPFNIDLL